MCSSLSNTLRLLEYEATYVTVTRGEADIESFNVHIYANNIYISCIKYYSEDVQSFFKQNNTETRHILYNCVRQICANSFAEEPHTGVMFRC